MDVFDAIRARKSIRRFKEEIVPMDLVIHIIEAAILAPSWHNKQGWNFVVLVDERRKLAVEALREVNPARNALLQAPVNIILCGNPDQSGNIDGKTYYMVDAACAMDHLMLAAIEKGLGTCWVGSFNEEFIKRTYNIPDNVRVIAMTPLGYPAYEPKPRPRKTIEEVAFLNEWGGKLVCDH